MLRVVRVIAASQSDPARQIDSVILSGDERRIQAGRFVGVKGTEIAFLLPEPVMLRMGDALELHDGSVVDVVITPEPLVEVRGTDVTHLARLAWHLGDRHVPVQLLANRLRLRRDPALETMLGALGARLTPIEAPFDPEGGAYAAQAAHAQGEHGHHHGHVHSDDCGHDHAHGHHGHGHKHHDDH